MIARGEECNWCGQVEPDPLAEYVVNPAQPVRVWA